ncbi:MAG: alpha/beta hydrolase [Candidatus Kapaibacterium sp.]
MKNPRSTSCVLSHAIVLLLCLLGAQAAESGAITLPTVSGGRIERMERFVSKHVTPRTIDIWLPDSYPKNAPYDVLYMHDGQMLFDSATTWNKQEWNVDDTASALMRRGACRPFIVVGIWNGGDTRHADYFPQKPLAGITRAQRDTLVAQLRVAGRIAEDFVPRSDAYLRCIVEEIKPLVDARYSVNTTREHTFIAGSSMGGLISLYALCEYPDVFGGAACISTHWIGTFTSANNPLPDAFLDYLGRHLPDPASHKLYFDCGDKTLDAYYPDIQRKVDALMTARGYGQQSWTTRYVPGADHSEKAWSKRLDQPLMFLLGEKVGTMTR